MSYYEPDEESNFHDDTHFPDPPKEDRGRKKSRVKTTARMAGL